MSDEMIKSKHEMLGRRVGMNVRRKVGESQETFKVGASSLSHTVCIMQHKYARVCYVMSCTYLMFEHEQNAE